MLAISVCASPGRQVEELEVAKVDKVRQQLTNKESSCLERERGLESVEHDSGEAQDFVKFQDCRFTG